MEMTDRDILELVAAKVIGIESRMDGLEFGIDKMDGELQEIKKTVINIENNHGEKLTALFDGYYQHTDMLERIQQEVSKHEEVILRKVK